MSNPPADAPVHILFADGRDARYWMSADERDRLVADFVRFRNDASHMSGQYAGSYAAALWVSGGGAGRPCRLGVAFAEVRFIG